MRVFFSAVAVALALLAAPPVVAQDLFKGLEAYQRGDYATALQELEPWAEQGDALAQYSLGDMYHKGWAVTQDYTEAVKWWRKAAEQGNVMAQYNLGDQYAKGEGVSQDYAEAVKWWHKAAEQGNAMAQFSLGILQDNVIAHMWVNLAALQGHKTASKLRDLIAEQMTPADISLARRLAAKCFQRKYKNCGR